MAIIFLFKPSSFLPFLIFFLSIYPSLSKKSTFIVYMSHSHKPNAFASSQDWYSSILHTLSSKETQHDDILYTYSHSATGFAAHISASLAAKLRHLPSVLSVIPDQLVEVATTQSPSFLGLSDESGIWAETEEGSDVIIGVIDSGIWPQHPSFHDEGLNKVPDTWRGTCESDFPAKYCNNKIIGARMFNKGYKAMNETLTITKPSILDSDGHGTHCASIAAGSLVKNAAYNGYAPGQARGVATKARIAIYKATWGGSGSLADITKAIDMAVHDGVHVISMSISSAHTFDYYEDPKTISALGAMHKGVVVSVAAGNRGPKKSTVNNVAPWMLTVGASTINREFPADLILGNGQTFTGSSLFKFDQSTPETQMMYLVTGEASGNKFCEEGQLDRSKVNGKMVLCENEITPAELKSYAVQKAGGLGMILVNQANFGDELEAYPFVIPSSTVKYTAGIQIKKYMSTVNNPTAKIKFKGTVKSSSSSPSTPRVASFSSRGPNRITNEILKPDVIAPGVNILAAWTGATTGINNGYNIMSGTSMACAHVSGLAALLRKAYPSWSPAAIKSAIMTTAYNLDNSRNDIIDLSTGKESSLFVRGSGHIDPNKALHPGLVYDLDTRDYIAFLCSIGYDNKKIAPFLKAVDQPMIDCNAKKISSPGNLNYPSFSVVFKSANDVVTYTRVVKNVESSVDTEYQVNVSPPSYVTVSVSPTKLVFNAKQKTLSYAITFTSNIGGHGGIAIEGTESFGSIEWSDGCHRVKSPIAAYWMVSSAQDDFVAAA